MRGNIGRCGCSKAERCAQFKAGEILFRGRHITPYGAIKIIMADRAWRGATLSTEAGVLTLRKGSAVISFTALGRSEATAETEAQADATIEAETRAAAAALVRGAMLTGQPVPPGATIAAQQVEAVPYPGLPRFITAAMRQLGASLGADDQERTSIAA